MLTVSGLLLHVSCRQVRCINPLVRRDHKQAYLWTLRRWNDASGPCPYHVVSQRIASRLVGFTLLGKCFLRHADVRNGVSALLLGSLGKQPWQSAEMRYGFWQLGLFNAPRVRSSPVRAKITIALSVRRVFYFFSRPSYFFGFGLLKWIVFPSALAHKAETIPSPHSLRLPSRCVLRRRCGCNCLQDQCRLRTKDLFSCDLLSLLHTCCVKTHTNQCG